MEEKILELFAINDSNKELYFQIEKTNEGLKTINKIAYELFGEEGYIFESKWQTGFPKGEDYENQDKGNIFMGVVLSEKRIHIIIKGLKHKAKIKKIIIRKYDFVK